MSEQEVEILAPPKQCDKCIAFIREFAKRTANTIEEEKFYRRPGDVYVVRAILSETLMDRKLLTKISCTVDQHGHAVTEIS